MADGEICRRQLLENIEAGNEEIVVFHAGAGYGKTTVMAELARNHMDRSCWYRIHESDNNIFHFLRGLAVSFSNIVPCFDTMPEKFYRVNSFCELSQGEYDEMSEDFFMRCLSASPAEYMYLFLDNYELIKNEHVQTFLLRFIEYGEGRIKFFFAARGGFPGFLAANMMRGKIREISADELCFNEQETGILLNRLAEKSLTRHIVKKVQKYTGGWPAGVVFAGRSFKSSRMQQENSILFDKTYLFHYIFSEIFRKISFEIQRFLLDISIFEKIEADVCNYVLRRTDAERTLEYLVRENIFLTRFGEETCFYRCEKIFADFLESRLPASRREEILLRAAKYYARRGNWEEAVRCSMECGEKGCGLVAFVVEKRAFSMYEEGKRELLKMWVDYLCEFREKLGESTLFCIYGCLRKEEREKESLEILKEAVEKAYRKQRFELYKTYMQELHRRKDAAENQKKTELFIKCLESFSVFGKNGEIAWRTKKTKELFACLFYEDGSWVAKDILMERLWPEKPLKKAVVLFHTTVSYLRKTLTENEAAAILLVKNQFYAIDMEHITSDIEILKRWNNRLKQGKIPDGENPEQLLELNYKGYMYGEDYVWVGVYKEHVEYQYLRMLKTLAEREKAHGNFVRAAAYLEKAVAINGYEISIREIFVECLLAGGNITGAKREYERLQKIRKELIGQEEEENFQTYVKKIAKTPNFSV